MFEHDTFKRLQWQVATIREEHLQSLLNRSRQKFEMMICISVYFVVIVVESVVVVVVVVLLFFLLSTWL